MSFRAAAVGVAVLALQAPAAAAAPPPTLTGEEFLTQSYDLFGELACRDNPDGSHSVLWNISGSSAIGPYDGRFSERGELTPSSTPGELFPIDLRSMREDFTFERPGAQVSGVATLPKPVDEAVDAAACPSGGDGFVVDTEPVELSYSATITTADGVFADRGKLVLTFDDQGPNGGSPTEITRSFTSSLSATEQQSSVLFGKRTPGASWSAMSANTKRASPFTLYFPATVRRIHAYIDGGGATTGSQTVRAVLYRNAGGNPGAYVTRSFEFNVPAGMSPRWVPFYLAPPAALKPGVYWIGLQSAATHQVARYAWDSVPNSRRYNVDVDSDGPSDPFGPALSDDQQMSIFAFGTY
jgi:hypothetical protein